MGYNLISKSNLSYLKLKSFQKPNQILKNYSYSASYAASTIRYRISQLNKQHNRIISFNI